ncbi:MAG: hypothetical protein Q9219_007164 [cf. Caloplaca sp. 3 TL-2023]
MLIFLNLFLLFFFPLALTLTLPPTAPTNPFDLTTAFRSHVLLPSNLTSLRAPPIYWKCFDPSPQLHHPTITDCDKIALGLLELDPTGRKEFLFSPRANADIHLPFALHWGTCMLDLRGLEPGSWDVFPMRMLVAGFSNLALT